MADPADAQEYRDLRQFLVRPSPTVGFALVRVDDPRIALRVRGRLARDVSASCRVDVLELQRSDDVADFVDRMQTALTHDALFVVGLERLLLDDLGARRNSPAVSNLNQRRDDLPNHIRGRVVIWLPEYAFVAYSEALRDFSEFVLTVAHLHEHDGDAIEPMRLIALDGWQPEVVGDARTRLEQHVEALVRLHATATGGAVAEIAGEISGAWISLGRLDNASEWTERAVAAYLASVQPAAAARELTKLAAARVFAGEYDLALALARRATELVDEAAADDVFARASTVHADVLIMGGKLAEARELLRNEALPRSGKSDRDRAAILDRLADIAFLRGELDESNDWRRQYEVVAERLGDERALALGRRKQAALLIERREFHEGLRILRSDVLPLFERLKEEREIAITWRLIADIEFMRGELAEAQRLYELQAHVFEQLGDVHENAVTWVRIADIARARGDIENAIRTLESHVGPEFERLGDEIALERVERKIAELRESNPTPTGELGSSAPDTRPRAVRARTTASSATRRTVKPVGHALLLALSDSDLAADPALDLVTVALAEFGFTNVICLSGRSLTRSAVFEAIEQLIAQVHPDDFCVFYYFGYGGHVRFVDLPKPADEFTFAYLHCTDTPAGDFESVLDAELIPYLSRLARVCDSLTTIIDASYSTMSMRRSSGVKHITAPAWIHEHLARKAELELAHESHPHVVRLAAGSPSFARSTPGGRVGLLSILLCEELRAISAEHVRVSWDSLAHRLRGRIFVAMKSEVQWLVCAGPLDRWLFSAESRPLPRTVGFVSTWLWAGGLQGVEHGDRWAIAGLDDQPRGVGVVVQVGLNRALLKLDSDTVDIGHARLARVARCSTVELAPTARQWMNAAITDSAWLTLSDGPGDSKVDIENDTLLISDSHFQWLGAQWPLDDVGTSRALELLDDQARSRRLLESTAQSPPGPIRVTWSSDGNHNPHRMRSDALFELRVDCLENSPNPWFVQIVFIDGIGRAWLLDPNQPEGVEVSRGDSAWIGSRFGKPTGLTLGWPEEAQAEEARCWLLAIACGRPLQLGHLARPVTRRIAAHPALHGGEDDLLAKGIRLRPEPTGRRASGEPLLTHRGASQRFEIIVTRSPQ